MQSYSINIGSQTIQIRSDANSEHVNKLAKMVRDKYNEFEKKGPRASQDFRAMTMVSLMLADELIESHKQNNAIESNARQFAEKMIAKIDEILGSSNKE